VAPGAPTDQDCGHRAIGNWGQLEADAVKHKMATDSIERQHEPCESLLYSDFG
jgi:hypothetical protein